MNLIDAISYQHMNLIDTIFVFYFLYL